MTSRLVADSVALNTLAPNWPVSPVSGPRDLHGQPLLLELTALHGGNSIREVATRDEWTLRPAPNVLPRHYRITHAVIRISQAIPQGEQPPQVMLYAGGSLIRSFALNRTSEPQEFRFDVPPSEYLRVSVQRTTRSGECLSMAPPVPMQLLPGTEVTATQDMAPFASLGDAAPTLRGNTRLYLDPAVMRSPEQLPALARLAAALGIDAAEATVQSAGKPIPAGQPFLLISTEAPAGVVAPVRFDRGEVLLTDVLGRALLQAPPIPNATIVQVVRAGASRGIWIRPSPSGSFSHTPRVELGTGDVAFLDDSGLLRGFDTRQVEVMQVRYPGIASYERWLSEHMVWLLGVAWIVITIIFVSLYRRFSRHKELV